jgi:16S rRNA (cytidine1402-2'-O)-methyltransferase
LLDSNPDMRKGEFVIVMAGQPEGGPDQTRAREMQRILGLLLAECSLKSAVHLTVQITGAGRDEVYREALRLKADNSLSGNGQRP